MKQDCTASLGCAVCCFNISVSPAVVPRNFSSNLGLIRKSQESAVGKCPKYRGFFKFTPSEYGQGIHCPAPARS